MRRRRTRPAEDGSAPLLGVGGLAAVMLVAVAVLDLGAYLTAAVRAQAAADAAALAAAAVAHPHGRARGLPIEAARALAEAHGASLGSCSCATGSRTVEVSVSVDVPAVVVTRFAARRVVATASATLVPPAAAPDQRVGWRVRSSAASISRSARSSVSGDGRAW
ncbi:MAG: hypothetical protein KY469_07365 [Actinobacteria bacterium]|nr:hypothetical protein [Actinomycetota bacterium]